MGDTGVQSCRGHAIIVGTCDNVREREGNNELVNLLTQAIEDLVELGELPAKWGRVTDLDEASAGAGGAENEDEDAPAAGSVAAMLAAELAQARDRDGNKGTGGGASVLSVNPNIKGIVLAKIMRPDVCPVRLLQCVFDKVKMSGVAHSKHLIRLIPCSRVFFPTTFELVANVRALVREKLPGVLLLPMSLPLVAASAVAEKEADVGMGDAGGEKGGREEKEANVEEVGETRAEAEKEEEEEAAEKGAGGDEEEGASAGNKRSREVILELREQRKAAKRAKAAVDAVKARTEGGHAAQRAISMESLFHAKEAAKAAGPDYVALAPPKPFAYEVTLKSRNHNTLSQSETRSWISKNMPAAPYAVPCYRSPDVSEAWCLFCALCEVADPFLPCVHIIQTALLAGNA